MDTADIIAIIISVIALLFSLYQFVFESSRKKKEDTLIAYNELQDDVFTKLNKLYKTLGLDDTGRVDIDETNDKWDDITSYLAKIERFCVGINSGIYSMDVLNRVGGGYFINTYNRLSTVIEKKRQKDDNAKQDENQRAENSGSEVKQKHYDEFEQTVKKLKAKRKKKA